MCSWGGLVIEPKEHLTTTKQTPWERARNQFLDAQGGLCGICRKPMARHEAQLDHSHTTGHIRGALCVGCNVRLGWYEANADNVTGYLKMASRYARRERRRLARSMAGTRLEAAAAQAGRIT